MTPTYGNCSFSYEGETLDWMMYTFCSVLVATADQQALDFCIFA